MRLEQQLAERNNLQAENDKLRREVDFLTISRDSFRHAYEQSHAAERYEIRLDDNGKLDEIVGHGRFHLEQMDTNEWFLELAGCALWINGRTVRLVPRDHNTWRDAKKSTGPTGVKE